MRQISLRLPEELHDRATHEAAKGHPSLQEWIREAIAEKLGRSGESSGLAELRERVAALERAIDIPPPL